MENKNNNHNVLITLAIFAIAILSSMAFIVQPSYAVSYVDITLTAPTTMVRHVIGGQTVFSTIDETNDVITTYKANDGSLLYSTDLTSAAESQGVTAGTAVPRAMTCSGDRCNVLFGVTHGTIFCEIVNVVPSSGSAGIRLNVTSTNGCASAMGQSGNSLYVSGTSGSSNDHLYEVDISQNPYVATDLNSFVGMGSPTACIVPLTLGANFYIGLCGSGNNAWFKLFRVSTATTCSATGNFIAEDVATDGTSAYVSLSTGDIKKVSSSCAVSSTISTATCGGEIHDVEISGQTKMFTFCESATAEVTYYNLTSNLKIATYECNGSSAGIANYVKGIAYDSTLDVIACASYTGNHIRLIYQQGVGGPTEGTFCDPIAHPENQNILICRVGGNGEIGSAGAFIVGNITQGTGVLGIGCSIGLVDCTTDDNPQTNGLGLLIFIASIFVVMGMFFAGIGMRDTFQLPIFVWIVIIIALSAFFTITGLINPIFLIISIIAIIAVAAPKIINTLRGGSFGGGSTA